MVRNSDVELAVIVCQSASPFLAYERCRQEELVLVASRKDRSIKRPTTAAQLSEVPLVMFKRGRKIGTGTKILNQLSNAGSGSKP